MGLIESVSKFLTLGQFAPPLESRTIGDLEARPDLASQLRALQGGNRAPWRPASIQEAIGVPAIHRAVTLIANVGGGLSMEAWRKGVKLANEDRPHVIVQPNPYITPRDFFRDTFYSMATRGEAWWWTAKRDADGQALSMLLIPAREITVTESDDFFRPTITWNRRGWAVGKVMPNEDMDQITLLREPGELRGFGPLQACGAAVSISVESQEWAANFFAAGGYPNLWIKAAGDLSGGQNGSFDPDDPEDDSWMSEVQRLKNQWIDSAPNTPKVTDEGIIDIKQFDPNPQGAQMLAARDFQNGDAAREFGIPGALMEYATAGSSLTYQNLSEVMTNFAKTCLIPNYLEPVEQTMSARLSRTTVAQFAVGGINRADIKTRFEVYKLGIESGVLTPEMAQQQEGIIAGDVETAPVPLAMPSAFPTPAQIPQNDSGSVGVTGLLSRSTEIRCEAMVTKRRSGIAHLEKCNRKLGVGESFVGKCPRCKTEYAVA